MIERYTRSFDVEAAEGDQYEITGRAICYNEPALIKSRSSSGETIEWYEIIDPGALSDCDMADVPMLLEHDRKEVVARSRTGSLSFTNRLDGLYINSKMLTSKGREVWESVRAGLLTAFSFAFPVDSAIKRDGTHNGLPLMRVSAISKLLDVSVVYNPAYEGTFANARSADWMESIISEDNEWQRLKLLLEVTKSV